MAQLRIIIYPEREEDTSDLTDALGEFLRSLSAEHPEILDDHEDRGWTLEVAA